MRIVSWNVNGLRSIVAKTFHALVAEVAPDILCLQETKVDPGSIPSEVRAAYPHCIFHCAARRGYSGTAILSKVPPVGHDCGSRPEQLLTPQEGRIIAADFGAFFLVNVYTPNAKAELTRLDLRKNQWDPAFLELLSDLDRQKPVVACGDFNVAHRPIDLARPEENCGHAGYTDEEREGFDHYLDAGLVDIFRHLHPGRSHAYSWWSYRGGARERNVGWRIDYFLGSARLTNSVTGCEILDHITGSDHAPVSMDFTPPPWPSAGS
jgi:exodeoxyribonuclease-3